MKPSSEIAIIVFVILAFARGTAFAQGAIEVTTDRPSYEYGETIQISVTISNSTDESFQLVGSSSCQAQFLFDSFDSYANTQCTTDELVIEFGPGSERTWRWDVVPDILGLPASDGEHTIVGYYPGSELSDPVEVVAPKYLGGRVRVGLAQGVSDEEIAPIKDSLDVEILNSFETEDGVTETWQISGVSVDEAVQRYAGDSRFRHFESERSIQYAEIVSTEEVPTQASYLEITPPYPNPCSSQCRLGLDVPTSQTVLVALYDLLGREIRVIHDGHLPQAPGHRFMMDVRSLANGPYILRADGEYASTSRLMQILK